MIERIEKYFGIGATVTMLLAIYMVFAWVPNEKIMGPVQKIFYFHVASAWVSFFAFFVVFVTATGYLITRNPKWDLWSMASAQIGLLFTTIVIISGPIWGRSAWGAWWTWDPRLVTTLILWFIYLGYVVIKASVIDKEKARRLAAIFGIIGFLDVPIIWFSVNWWNTIHPKVVSKAGIAISSKMLITLLISILAITLFYGWMLPRLYRIELLKERLELVKDQMKVAVRR